MQSRPQLKLTLTNTDRNIELAGIVFLLVMWALTAYSFIHLPAIIPTHFNASGLPNAYGSKMTLLLLPVLATIIFAGLTQLNKYPHLFNYMPKITAQNATKQYRIATRLLRYIKLAIAAIFSLVILFIYLTSRGITKGMGYWFLPLVLIALLLPTFISIRESFKKENNSE